MLQYCVNISIKNVKDHPLVKIKLREKMYLHFAATKLVSLKKSCTMMCVRRKKHLWQFIR